MLKKINRLTKDKEFNGVFKSGKSSYDKITGFKILPNGLSYNQFGIMVGTKVSKKAVDRNKIKRQIREIIRLQSDNIKQGFDCVVICLPEILGKTHKDIEKSINNHIKKLNL